MKNHFFELPRPALRELSDFSLVPQIYEQEIASRNGGLDLGNHNQLRSLDKEHLKHYKLQLFYLRSSSGFYPVIANNFNFRSRFVIR